MLVLVYLEVELAVMVVTVVHLIIRTEFKQAQISLSGGYTMTLGEENMSNATGNVVLVRIALASGTNQFHHLASRRQ